MRRIVPHGTSSPQKRHRWPVVKFGSRVRGMTSSNGPSVPTRVRGESRVLGSIGEGKPSTGRFRTAKKGPVAGVTAGPSSTAVTRGYLFCLSFWRWTMLASALLAVLASHDAAPVLRRAARALTVVPQTLAATLIGACTVIGTPTLLSAAICVSLRKFFRMSTFWTLTATSPLPLPVLTWANAGLAVAATAAAAITNLRITSLQLTAWQTQKDALHARPPFPASIWAGWR